VSTANTYITYIFCFVFALILTSVIKKKKSDQISPRTAWWGQLPFQIAFGEPLFWISQFECHLYYNKMSSHVSAHYAGAGHIIRISSKSWFISLIPFKKWNLYNVYIYSTYTDIFKVFISFNFDDYNWQLMKTPNSVSQKIRILLKTNTKKGFLEILANWKVWTWKVWACTALNT